MRVACRLRRVWRGKSLHWDKENESQWEKPERNKRKGSGIDRFEGAEMMNVNAFK